MADDRRSLPARPVFGRKKIASQRQLRAKQREELRGDVIRIQSFSLAGAGQRQVISSISRDLGERLALFAPRGKMRGAHKLNYRLRIKLSNPDQLIRVTIWQRSQ